MSADFLLEIGVEEIPDWMIEPALRNLRELFEEVAQEHRLGGTIDFVEGTPRRLALRVNGLSTKQEDEIRTTLGPPVAAGPGAAAGFAKKMGVASTDLKTVESAKGSYYSLDKPVAGRETLAILSETLPGIITCIHFPKAMYWTGKSGVRFIRPIRWIVALLGHQVVSFTVADVESGNVTRGHRRLGKASIEVSIETYEGLLKENSVILRAAERRSRIEAGLDASVRRDESLLNTLVYLTEYPSTFQGEFDPAYLKLPEEILTTVMRHHQRYFSRQDADGRLAPSFVGVLNAGGDPEGLIRLGNERVLRARFNDARFFWDVDQKKKLADRLDDLTLVTFQAKLGSYREKTDRVAALASQLAGFAGVDPNLAERAATLSKCDLTTEMVKEFTELQGIVGGLYARHQGEPDEVWKAIYGQYKPASMEDSIPETRAGQVLALADRLDTLRGCFDIGLAPTGSKDPFALRRAAQGAVKIIVEAQLRIPLDELLRSHPQLREFILDRVRYYFKDVRGFAYDEISAVLTAGSSDLVDVDQRLKAVQDVRPTENFEPLAGSFKRVKNILRQADFQQQGEADPALLESGAEKDLFEAFARIRSEVAAQRDKHEYGAALSTIASLRPQVDLFFDKVLVNAPDAAVRHNRLMFLNSLLTEFSSIADFSEIVTGQ